ncbi:TadE/TadG family type IV pilus assembly protein [Haloimpatiens sp. FM7330]|uniref:TadE/TadG family type IV pilus assembly protein n=1 Tax=Haloimpatiens sp. FM7330 TaxID=3298610 RepID=UPI003627A809
MRLLKNKNGQSLVEFAIIFPLILLVVMAIAEFGMIFNAYLTINNAAREGARAGIVGTSDVEIQNLVLAASPNLESQNLTIIITPNETSRTSGETLTVTLNYTYHTIVPIISGIIDDTVVLNAQTSMRIE